MAILSACCCILSFRAVWNSHCILIQYCTLAPSRIAHRTYCTYSVRTRLVLYVQYRVRTVRTVYTYYSYCTYCSQQHLCTAIFAFSVPCTVRSSFILSTIRARFRAESPFSLASHSQLILNLR